MFWEGVAERGKGWGWGYDGGWGRGWGNDGGEEGGGEGVGGGFNQSFEQNRYRYLRLGCQNARSNTKLEQNHRESPILGESPL